MNRFLTVKDISFLLQISRSKAYSIMNNENLQKYKIDKCLRVREKDFYIWLKKYKKML